MTDSSPSNVWRAVRKFAHIRVLTARNAWDSSSHTKQNHLHNHHLLDEAQTKSMLAAGLSPRNRNTGACARRKLDSQQVRGNLDFTSENAHDTEKSKLTTFNMWRLVRKFSQMKAMAQRQVARRAIGKRAAARSLSKELKVRDQARPNRHEESDAQTMAFIERSRQTSQSQLAKGFANVGAANKFKRRLSQSNKARDEARKAQAVKRNDQHMARIVRRASQDIGEEVGKRLHAAMTPATGSGSGNQKESKPESKWREEQDDEERRRRHQEADDLMLAFVNGGKAKVGAGAAIKVREKPKAVIARKLSQQYGHLLKTSQKAQKVEAAVSVMKQRSSDKKKKKLQQETLQKQDQSQMSADDLMLAYATGGSGRVGAGVVRPGQKLPSPKKKGRNANKLTNASSSASSNSSASAKAAEDEAARKKRHADADALMMQFVRNGSGSVGTGSTKKTKGKGRGTTLSKRSTAQPTSTRTTTRTTRRYGTSNTATARTKKTTGRTAKPAGRTAGKTAKSTSSAPAKKKSAGPATNKARSSAIMQKKSKDSAVMAARRASAAAQQARDAADQVRNVTSDADDMMLRFALGKGTGDIAKQDSKRRSQRMQDHADAMTAAAEAAKVAADAAATAAAAASRAAAAAQAVHDADSGEDDYADDGFDDDNHYEDHHQSADDLMLAYTLGHSTHAANNKLKGTRAVASTTTKVKKKKSKRKAEAERAAAELKGDDTTPSSASSAGSTTISMATLAAATTDMKKLNSQEAREKRHKEADDLMLAFATSGGGNFTSGKPKRKGRGVPVGGASARSQARSSYYNSSRKTSKATKSTKSSKPNKSNKSPTKHKKMNSTVGPLPSLGKLSSTEIRSQRRAQKQRSEKKLPQL